MPKSGFDCTDDIKRFGAHKTGVKRAMIRAGKQTVTLAQKGVQDAAPVQTGALRIAVYQATREINGQVTSDYERNIVTAAGKNQSIENQGKALSMEDLPPTGEAESASLLAIAVNYADALIDGYHNARTGRAVAPRDFWNPAVEDAAARYESIAQAQLNGEVAKLEQ